ncbi:hypothetical protein EHP00_2711 [Ecytonucleospora hepatopenaei]|uniref:Uncharacterized protein n=1 Tax=Ecytonucleospora hepatopenaei TaxID=646526 RepID=A0A1W0E6X0_9MICR|nr:hypothetical protein EHP00_976 [Ecytonucleospora hepatopenaei]OQS54909.1 hypothetical protein EHP00_2711 [Ecytonucleospora hepatopenaei]
MLFFNLAYSIRLIYKYDNTEGCEPLKRNQIILQPDHGEGAYKVTDILTNYELPINSLCIIYPDLIQDYINNGFEAKDECGYTITKSNGDVFTVVCSNTGPSEIEEGILSNQSEALEILNQIGLFLSIKKKNTTDD